MEKQTLVPTPLLKVANLSYEKFEHSELLNETHRLKDLGGRLKTLAKLTKK